MVDKSQKLTSEFLKQFTLSILRVIEKRKFNIPETKIIVDADLIPELSEQLMREYAQNQELLKKLEALENMNFLEPEPVRLKPLSPSQHKGLQNIGLKPQVQSTNQPVINVPSDTSEGNGYEKIRPLMEDYSVSRIQCIAPMKPLIIIRSGQRQVTRITLNQNEIHDVFLYFAETAHIPLIEGPFKVLLKEAVINGINSKLMDSKFIVQKQTAYSLLESPGGPGLGMPMRNH